MVILSVYREQRKVLRGAREKGAKIQIVYSPADAEKYEGASGRTSRVFLSVGFEDNNTFFLSFSKKGGEEEQLEIILSDGKQDHAQAYEALKGSADMFLYPGHVNAITGTKAL